MISAPTLRVPLTSTDCFAGVHLENALIELGEIQGNEPCKTTFLGKLLKTPKNVVIGIQKGCYLTNL